MSSKLSYTCKVDGMHGIPKSQPLLACMFPFLRSSFHLSSSAILLKS